MSSDYFTPRNTCRRVFFLFFIMFWKSHIFFQVFCFRGPFFGTVYGHVVEHQSFYCIAAPQAQHSAAQSARTKPQSKYVPIRLRQRKQASRQSLRKPSHVVEHLYRTLSSRNDRRNQNQPGLQKYTTIHYSHSAGVMREGIAVSFDLNKIRPSSSFSPSFHR